ncbi:MAG: hypothetical protein AAF500_17860 [Myxococcota bacterium]
MAATETLLRFDEVRSVLTRHLPTYIVDPGRVAYVRHPLLPDPGPIRSLFQRVCANSAEPVDVGSVGKNVRIRIEGSQSTFRLVALVEGYDDGATILLAVDDMFGLRTVTESEASERDGVLQLFGGANGAVALTEAQMRAQVGQTLCRGGNAIVRLGVEKYVHGEWVLNTNGDCADRSKGFGHRADWAPCGVAKSAQETGKPSSPRFLPYS